MNISELIEKSQSLLDAGRFKSGLDGFEQALQISSPLKCFVHYNLGVAHQMLLGNGALAREHFLLAIEQLGAGKGYLPMQMLAQIHSNACENMLLSSLSYEEHEDWARRLAQLQPANDGLREHMREMKAKGLGWGDVMLQMALAYASGDPAHDAGRHGNAAAIYDLILRNRRQVGITREDYRCALIRFAALKTMIYSDSGQQMELARGKAEPQELSVILDGVPEVLDQYLERNPADQEVRSLVQKVREALRIGTPAAVPEQLKAPAEPPRPFESELDWQANSSLQRATQATQLQGLRFQLQGMQVDPRTGFLMLAFRALQPVDSRMWEEAGLALRAVVALTLPVMAAHSSRVQFADQGIQYNIALAQGIPVMGLMLTDGKDVIGPLQVGSFVADSLWYAAVKPIFVRTGTEQVQIAAQCRIFAELVPVIGSLQARIVTL